LIDGAVVLDSFTDATIVDVDRLALAGAVRHVIDPYYDIGTALRGYVAARLKNGREVIATTNACTGTPENPWDRHGIIAKFRLLTESVIGVAGADELVSLMPALRSLDRVDEIMANVAASRTPTLRNPA
jgi:hypothetical protein